jgi:hypothetical protein
MATIERRDFGGVEPLIQQLETVGVMGVVGVNAGR